MKDFVNEYLKSDNSIHIVDPTKTDPSIEWERKRMMAKVWRAYKFPNGMVVTFDAAGNQWSELQGVYSKELFLKIVGASDENTELHGF